MALYLTSVLFSWRTLTLIASLGVAMATKQGLWRVRKMATDWFHGCFHEIFTARHELAGGRRDGAEYFGGIGRFPEWSKASGQHPGECVLSRWFFKGTFQKGKILPVPFV